MKKGSKKNIVFIGMEETGYACLEKLLSMRANVSIAYTIDESMKDKIIAFKSFDSLKKRFGIEIKKVKDINEPSIISEIRRINPDLIYIVSWSQLIHQDILKTPSLGCVGFHATLLPKHRGRAPIPWSIIFGLRKSGLTMFYFTERADDGDIIGQEEFNITDEDDAYSVYKKVENCAVRLLERYHNAIFEGTAPRIKQTIRDTDYWHKRVPSDGYIDWNKSARYIYDWIRALTYPFPCAFTYYGDKKVFIWKSRIFSNEPKYKSGKIYKDFSNEGVIVGTGEGAIAIEQVQFESGEKLTASDFLEEIEENEYFK